MSNRDLDIILDKLNQCKLDIDYLLELKTKISSHNTTFDCFLMNRIDVLETYRDRFFIQKEIIGKEEVKGFESLIINLENSTSEEISLCHFEFSDNSYILFNTEQTILGVLKNGNGAD